MRAVITPHRSFPADVKPSLRRDSELQPGRIATLVATVALCAVIVWTFTASPARAASGGVEHLSPENLALPAQYGTIIYRTNAQGPGQLFIVGISHRDAENRLNHHDTAQTQLEIFRIGEWLHRNQGLELLLPEGYFAGEQGGPSLNDRVAAGGMDTDQLYARLADDSRFVNAEMLLMEQFGLPAAQVEEKNSYKAVCMCLGELTKKSCSRMQMTAKLDELQYLQEMRTAGMLQNIPAAIEAKQCAGTIRKPSAMMTIGLGHLQDIIRYLENNTITITPPEPGSDRMEGYTAELALLRKGYGVTVIIPRTLADDRELLQATRLEAMLPQDNLVLADNAPGQPFQ